MLFANIERAVVRLELTMCQCFMVLFKLSGLLTWSWILILWPTFVAVGTWSILEWKRSRRCLPNNTCGK